MDINTVEVPDNAVGFSFIRAKDFEAAEKPKPDDIRTYYFGQEKDVVPIATWIKKYGSEGNEKDEELKEQYEDRGTSRALLFSRNGESLKDIPIQDSVTVIDRKTREVVSPPVQKLF